MSLILDALRKSEAERRRGQLPALALELPPAPARRTPSRAWWLALPAALILAAAVYFNSRPQPAETAFVEAGAPSANTQPPLPAPSPAEVPHPPTVVGGGAVGEGFERAMDGARPALGAGRGLVPANPSPAAPAPPPEAELPIFETPDIASTEAPPVIALSDLTPTERQALPPLKLSMHMWSPDPAQRFAILDGQRVVEGDRLGSAVVERIEPDGVILAAEGRLVRLPLP